MKTTLIAGLALLGLAATAPAFAENGAGRENLQLTRSEPRGESYQVAEARDGAEGIRTAEAREGSEGIRTAESGSGSEAIRLG